MGGEKAERAAKSADMTKIRADYNQRGPNCNGG